MSTTRNTPLRNEDERKVAHELANLVDGSLRNLGLALSHLHDMEDVDSVDDATMQRIQTARTGMEQMAMLLKRWMVEAQSPVGLFQEQLTLAAAIERAVHLLEPAALERDIDLVVGDVDGAEQLSAGPLFTVIINAIRNAIEAIAAAGPASRDRWRIEVACHVTDGIVSLTVADNGPGIDPAMLDAQGNVVPGRTTRSQGHGVGLALAAEVAQALGGSVSLGNGQSRGAQFTLRCPIDRLERKEAAHVR